MKPTTLILLMIMSAQVMAGPKDRENKLNLTASQKEQMAEVKARTQLRMQEAKNEIHAQAKTEMAEFLSPEQLAQVEARLAHRAEHAKLRREHQQLKRKARQHKRFDYDGDE
ncbi:hypothetical protein OS175_04670 [Marinicella sp. S1101]|uniref:hypothetical protein n=1 Tax=Marinicella marina TaxID=2996016 RepID=UPI0022609A88|nr:hypothetical protein [Marinicella marina]MCX7553161.1 hypothetical protein [Marinicella marina]MDJ1138893.1 hypothetical protein [Marinicella marina]